MKAWRAERVVIMNDLAEQLQTAQRKVKGRSTSPYAFGEQQQLTGSEMSSASRESSADYPDDDAAPHQITATAPKAKGKKSKQEQS